VLADCQAIKNAGQQQTIMLRDYDVSNTLFQPVEGGAIPGSNITTATINGSGPYTMTFTLFRPNPDSSSFNAPYNMATPTALFAAPWTNRAAVTTAMTSPLNASTLPGVRFYPQELSGAYITRLDVLGQPQPATEAQGTPALAGQL
jgi:hypothetical protein